jgi:hypothetical protein
MVTTLTAIPHIGDKKRCPVCGEGTMALELFGQGLSAYVITSERLLLWRCDTCPSREVVRK